MFRAERRGLPPLPGLASFSNSTSQNSRLKVPLLRGQRTDDSPNRVTMKVGQSPERFARTVTLGRIDPDRETLIEPARRRGSVIRSAPQESCTFSAGLGTHPSQESDSYAESARRWNDIQIRDLCSPCSPVHVVHKVPRNEANKPASAVDEKNTMATCITENVPAELVSAGASMTWILFPEVVRQQGREGRGIFDGSTPNGHASHPIWLINKSTAGCPAPYHVFCFRFHKNKTD